MRARNQKARGDDQFDVFQRSSRLAPFGLAAAITVAMAVAAACGSDGTSQPAASDAVAPSNVDPTGPASAGSAVSGEQLSRSKGCAGCHGQDFDGGAGPGWIGLAGSQVILVDGTTLVADDDYLTRAIAEPAADLVEGYNLKMPANNLSDAEVADIVAFINTLADG